MAARKEAGAAEMVTLEEWKLMRPWAQGFVFYMHPGQLCNKSPQK